MSHQRKKHKNNYKQNHGVPGVVYILDNPGLKAGMLKIGCSRRSGESRARDLNFDATTGTPGTFGCVFEYRTKDCGKAEERVFQKLNPYRRGKWGQEYFEVALAKAKETIIHVCTVVDSETKKYLPPPNTIQVGDFSNAKFGSKYIPISNAPPIVTSSISREHATRTPRVRWLWRALAVIIPLWIIFGTKNIINPLRKEPVSNSHNNVSKTDISSPTVETSNSLNVSKSLKSNISSPREESSDLKSTGREERVQINMSDLTRDEQSSIESVCAEAKVFKGPVAYNRCVSKQLASLEGTPRNLDMSWLTRDEESSIESVCAEAKVFRGPVAYNRCVSKQLASLKAQIRH
jgi:hypothetical protein